MVYEDVIRDRLDQPEITIENMSNPEGGGWTVFIDFTGNERNLRRLIGEHFDIQDTIPNDNGGIKAVVKPVI